MCAPTGGVTAPAVHARHQLSQHPVRTVISRTVSATSACGSSDEHATRAWVVCVHPVQRPARSKPVKVVSGRACSKQASADGRSVWCIKNTVAVQHKSAITARVAIATRAYIYTDARLVHGAAS